MSKKVDELQAYLDEIYPDMKMQVSHADNRQLMIAKITIPLETFWLFDVCENESKIKGRILEALGHAKGVIEHNIIDVMMK